MNEEIASTKHNHAVKKCISTDKCLILNNI